VGRAELEDIVAQAAGNKREPRAARMIAVVAEAKLVEAPEQPTARTAVAWRATGLHPPNYFLKFAQETVVARAASRRESGSGAAGMPGQAAPVMNPCPPNYFRKVAWSAQAALHMAVPEMVVGQAASQRESNLAASVARAELASPEMGPRLPNCSPMARQRTEKAALASRVMDRRLPNYFPKIARAQAQVAVMRRARQVPADRARSPLALPAQPAEFAALQHSAQAQAD
jgi:hypothetical protein